VIQRLFMSGLCLSALVAADFAHAGVELTSLGGGQFQARFRYLPTAAVRSVHVAGTFNGWDPRAFALTRAEVGGAFGGELVLAKGRHEYKFVINGDTWIPDPDNPLKTTGYENSILLAGVDLNAGGANQLVARAAVVAHPPMLAKLVERQSAGSAAGLADAVRKLAQDQPLPWICEDSVTFIHLGPAAAPPTVRVYAHGARLGYELPELMPQSDVYATTLDRAAFPRRWAYLLAVPHADRTEVLRDPFGWSVTSRDGMPVTMGAGPEAGRGRIELIEDLTPTDPQLPPRDIYVYLPPGYTASTARRYPVLYMHDGQNSWDDPVQPFGHGGWMIHRTADELIAGGTVEPFIVVAIANTSRRMREYGPGASIFSLDDHAYLKFVVNELKPRIDATYRTQPAAGRTAMLGASLGGVISLQAAMLCPEVVGMAACMSPSLQIRDASGVGYLELVNRLSKRPVKLYVDHGTGGRTGDGAERARAFIAALRRNGWRDGVDLLCFEDSGGRHNERAWRARVHRPLTFFFGKTQSASSSAGTGGGS
jgi:enterochelin esterase-like enzyme